jgi:hypothetical protein
MGEKLIYQSHYSYFNHTYNAKHSYYDILVISYYVHPIKKYSWYPLNTRLDSPRASQDSLEKRKISFFYKDSNPRSPRLQSVHYTDSATLAPLRAEITTIMDSLHRR